MKDTVVTLPQERVFIDVKVNRARRSGYFVRCNQLRQAIEKIEKKGQSLVVFGDHVDRKVVGIVYDGSNTMELILDPPIGDDEE